jgi:sarcosine oxidase subunit gamma
MVDAAIVDAAIEGDGFTLREAPRAGKIVLRGDPGDDAFMRAVRAALDIDLPLAANTSSETAPLSALWLGPDEWLLLCAEDSASAVIESLRAALSGQHAAIVDIGDSRCVLRLTGPAARDLLARGCALDLHPREFALGAVAQTRLALAEVILHRSAEDGFDIYVARSFADYSWRWLADAIAVG